MEMKNIIGSHDNGTNVQNDKHSNEDMEKNNNNQNKRSAENQNNHNMTKLIISPLLIIQVATILVSHYQTKNNHQIVETEQHNKFFLILNENRLKNEWKKTSKM